MNGARIIGAVVSACVTLSAARGFAQEAGVRTNLAPSAPIGPGLTNRLALSRSTSSTNRLMLNGVIVALDPTNHWLEIRGTNGLQRVSFRTNALVLLTGQRIPTRDLQVGDHAGLLARYHTNGHWELISLHLGARPPGAGNLKRTDQPQTDR